MQDHTEDQIDRMFHALSDRTRRKMLLRLAKEQLNVSELGQPFGLTKQAISKHLKVLEEAQLIRKQKDGRIQRCEFDINKFAIVQDVVDEYRKFWEGQFDVLEQYIEKVKKDKE